MGKICYNPKVAYVKSREIWIISSKTADRDVESLWKIATIVWCHKTILGTCTVRTYVYAQNNQQKCITQRHYLGEVQVNILLCSAY